jgi:5-hydroxyisourate hydrolase-like protein (transthyretin family)
MYIDEYKIKASEKVRMSNREEIRINLELEKNPEKNTGTVRGTIVDNDGNPIGGATVKLCYASTLDPFNHTNTNPQGNYIFNNVPVGSYQIAAIKDGYEMPLAISLSVVKNKATQVDITLVPNPNANKNIIYGIVKSNVDNLPVKDAIAQLYKVASPEDELFATASTNKQGQYFFVDVDNGDYYVKVTKLGFYSTDSAQITVTEKEYVPVDISLVSDPSSNTGTICGVITDEETNLPVENASVALYEITGDTETLIKLTKTSVEGKYIFGNIVRGSYRIKSTVQEEDI